jgi:Trypsin-like peptidase domain
VDIVAGRDVVLELTAGNAEVEPVASTTTDSGTSLKDDPSFLLQQWRDSVVAVWSPNNRASAFLIDARGLIATNQRVIGTATSVEVQVTEDIKVGASVLVADPERDVALLWIDPAAVASARPLSLECPAAETVGVVEGQQIFTIGNPFRQPQKEMTSGTVRRVSSDVIESNLILPNGSAGGPVFSAEGNVVGVTSPEDDQNGRRRVGVRTVRAVDVCRALVSAEEKMRGAVPPSGAHLPMEPVTPFPIGELRNASERRAGNLNPYQLSSAAFDVAFITPVHTYGAQLQSERMSQRASSAKTRPSSPEPVPVRPLMNFYNWSEYVDDFPPVLLVRVTPKLTENFWTTIARGAAQTQGVAIPAIKRVKSGFSHLRAYCGDVEVKPIHPFKLEHRLSPNDDVDEGLYVFDPGAFGPQCGSVRLVLHSEKEPERGDNRVVDARIVEQIWQDFAPYREVSR